jgi:hypothetical protein
MPLQKLFFFLFFLGFSMVGLSQKIVYSEPDRRDSRRMDFEVIGKIGGNFLVYKDLANRSYITVYDNDMKEIGKVEHEYGIPISKKECCLLQCSEN